MDLCLMIEGQEGVTWPQWLALARACEEHRVPALFRSDHYQNLDGRHPRRGALDAWGTLNALAGLTSKLRLGTLVSPASFRHPSQLAKLVSTADHVSGGRVELGLGAGWHRREHEAHGFPFAATRVRMDVLEEQLQILLGNWSEGPFSFEGHHYALHDLDAHPKPLQHPHPPLIVGGSGGPRSLALAARFADEYNTPFPTLEQARERLDLLAAACERAGRETIPCSIMIGLILGADRSELRERIRRVAALRGEDARAFLDAPPAGWIVGTVEQATEQLVALRDGGVHRVMCQHLLHDELETVALLGGEVATLLA